MGEILKPFLSFGENGLLGEGKIKMKRLAEDTYFLRCQDIIIQSELEIWKQYGCNVAWGGISQAAVIHKVPFSFFKLLKATSTIISLIFFSNLSSILSVLLHVFWGLVVKNMSLKLLYFPNNWPFLKIIIKKSLAKCVCVRQSILSSISIQLQWHPLQSSCLENPWTEEPARLQSMGSLRIGPDWTTSLSLFTFLHWRRKWQPTPVFLPGESQGRGSLVGCHLWGHTELDITEEI